MGKRKKGHKKKENKQAKSLQSSASSRRITSSDVGHGILAKLAAVGISKAVMALLTKIRRRYSGDRSRP